jgi:hypothetical protein
MGLQPCHHIADTFLSFLQPLHVSSSLDSQDVTASCMGEEFLDPEMVHCLPCDLTAAVGYYLTHNHSLHRGIPLHSEDTPLTVHPWKVLFIARLMEPPMSRQDKDPRGNMPLSFGLMAVFKVMHACSIG